MKEGPEWYDSVDPKQLYSRGDLQDLKFLSTLVLVAKNNAAVGMDLTQSFFQIRKRIQAMEFYTSLSPILVKKSGLLEDKGLPLIFKNRAQGVDFPSDIRADADMLFRKWMSGQIDPHLLRGIVTKKFGESTLETGIKSYSFEQGFSGRVSCNYIGVGNLVNGQWWPFQICAKRDGAHGYHEAGIHGQVCPSRISCVACTDGPNHRKIKVLIRLSWVGVATPTWTMAIPLSTVVHMGLRFRRQFGQV